MKRAHNRPGEIAQHENLNSIPKSMYKKLDVVVHAHNPNMRLAKQPRAKLTHSKLTRSKLTHYKLTHYKLTHSKP